MIIWLGFASGDGSFRMLVEKEKYCRTEEAIPALDFSLGVSPPYQYPMLVGHLVVGCALMPTELESGARLGMAQVYRTYTIYTPFFFASTVVWPVQTYKHFPY